ncbi:unnamed protein product [Ixodes pacificus]
MVQLAQRLHPWQLICLTHQFIHQWHSQGRGLGGFNPPPPFRKKFQASPLVCITPINFTTSQHQFLIGLTTIVQTHRLTFLTGALSWR